MESLEINDIIDLYNFRSRIKNRIYECFKLIRGLSLYNVKSVTSTLHFDYDIESTNFRFYLIIHKATFTLVLCKKGCQCTLKNNFNSVLELGYYVLEIKKNFSKIINYKKYLSSYILSKINYDYLYSDHKKNVILLEKIKIFSKVDLPQEILDIIIIKLF